MLRIWTALLSLALAIVTVGFIAPSPAAAAPPRANGDNNDVIFIHGFSPTQGENCSDYWSVAGSHFKANGWAEPGQLRTFGFYGWDEECSYSFRNANGDPVGSWYTSIETLGRAFAWEIFNRYTKLGKKVDVVAHSMGGLIVRAALTFVARGSSPGAERGKPWPPYLYIEDVVTLSTPHDGTMWGYALADDAVPTQLLEMRPGSRFLASLQDLPVSAMGTEWSVISAFGDAVVSEGSGVNVNAANRYQYDAAFGTLGHQLQRYAAGNYQRRDNHRSGWSWGSRPAPLYLARQAVYDHSGV